MHKVADANGYWMADNGKYLHKRKPSAHQKQLRFFTVLFICASALIMLGILWLVNRSH
jgi:hypothetical protein